MGVHLTFTSNNGVCEETQGAFITLVFHTVRCKFILNDKLLK